MIIIGSYAAELGGFYPSWRDKPFKDIDIVCDEKEFFKTMDILGGPGHLHKGTHCTIVSRTRILEITGIRSDMYNLMESLCEEQEVDVDGKKLTMYVASPEVVWATLYYTAGCVKHYYEKSFKDLFHYQKVVAERNLLNDKHWNLAHFYRVRMIQFIQKNMENNND